MNSSSPTGAWKVVLFGWKIVYFYEDSTGKLIKSENEFLEVQDPEVVYTVDLKGLNDKIWEEGLNELDSALSVETAYNEFLNLYLSFQSCKMS